MVTPTYILISLELTTMTNCFSLSHQKQPKKIQKKQTQNELNNENICQKCYLMLNFQNFFQHIAFIQLHHQIEPLFELNKAFLTKIINSINERTIPSPARTHNELYHASWFAYSYFGMQLLSFATTANESITINCAQYQTNYTKYRNYIILRHSSLSPLSISLSHTNLFPKRIFSIYNSKLHCFNIKSLYIKSKS